MNKIGVNSNYRIPKYMVKHEYEIKKSRFICWIAPASNKNQALQLLHQARVEYPDARHHCWAYILGNPNNATSAASNDDGEPSGSAGKPILNVLQHKHIGDVVAVVIRYFGGIKLGVGGLVRAYSAATQQSTELLVLKEHIKYDEVNIECGYADEPVIRRWIDSHQGHLLKSDYGVMVNLKINLPLIYFDDLRALISTRQDNKIYLVE